MVESFDMETANMSNVMVGREHTITQSADGLAKSVKENTDKITKSVGDSTADIQNKTDTLKASFDKNKWTFSGVADGLGETFRSAISKIKDYWDPFVDSVNGEHTLFGKTFNVNLPKIKLPGLAQGAVIPPNKEFMAVLGDQKNGTNIETPLDTMIEAFNTALSQNNGGGRTEINFLLPDRRKVAQYVLEGGRVIQTSTGRNPFELA